jgi:hypothetical protein
MYDSNMNTHSFIYRGEANEIDHCSIITNVLESSCLIVVVPAFSVSLTVFFSRSVCVSLHLFFSFLLRDIDGGGSFDSRVV